MCSARSTGSRQPPGDRCRPRRGAEPSWLVALASLGCSTSLARCRDAGTSADAQLAVFRAHEKSESRERALDAVNDWLAAATLQ